MHIAVEHEVTLNLSFVFCGGAGNLIKIVPAHSHPNVLYSRLIPRTISPHGKTNRSVTSYGETVSEGS